MDMLSSAPVTYVRWSATGLPNGLSIDPNTGIITGTPQNVEDTIATITCTTNFGTSTIRKSFKCVLIPFPIITSEKETSAYPNDNITYTLTAYSIDGITGEKLNNSITRYFLGDPPEIGSNIPTINTSTGYITYKVPSMKEINPPDEIILNIGCENTYEKETILPYKVNVLVPNEFICTNTFDSLEAYPTDYINYTVTTTNTVISTKILFNDLDINYVTTNANDYKIFNGHTYRLFNTTKTWNEAKELCESLGGHLAVILNQETNDFIINNMGSDYYIGGHKYDYEYMDTKGKDSSTWYWITNDDWNEWNENQFYSDQPNDDGNSLYIYNNKFGDTNEANKKKFICEWDRDLSNELEKLVKPSSLTLNTSSKNINWNVPTTGSLGSDYKITFIMEDNYGQTLSQNIFINIKEAPSPIIEFEINDVAYMLENSYTCQVFAYTPLYDGTKLTSGNVYSISNISYGTMTINSNTGLITVKDLDLNTPYPYITADVTVKNKYGKENTVQIKIPTCAPKSYLPVIDQTYTTYSLFQYQPITPLDFGGRVIHGCKLYNGHVYKYISTSMTWKNAKKYCESLSGHLIYIKNIEENNFINSMQQADIWIGATDEETEGTWKFINGEELTYFNWNPGEPNNSGNYMHMYTSGKWDDTVNESSLTFICEWDSTQNSLHTFIYDNDNNPPFIPENIKINEPVEINATVINTQTNEIIIEEFTYN